MIADERPLDSNLAAKRLDWSEEMLVYFRQRRRQLVAEMRVIDREMRGIQDSIHMLRASVSGTREPVTRRPWMQKRRFRTCRSGFNRAHLPR